MKFVCRSFFDSKNWGEIAPVIGVTKTDNGLLEFNRNFYDYSDNLLLMKIDNKKAYKVIDELQIPDAAPYIENDITMVPLRATAEALGKKVMWYGNARFILIADSFNFAESDTAKLENAAKGFERGFN